MKKLLALFLVIALMLTSCIALISCNKNDQVPGGDENGDNTTNTPNTPDYAAMEPAELFKTVILDAVTTETDGYFSVFEKLLSAQNSSMAASGSVEVEVSNILLASAVPGLMLNKITADYDVSSVSDLGAFGKIDLSCGDVELGKLEVYFDQNTYDMYLALPGLADGTVKVNLMDLMSGQSSYDDYEYDDSFDYDDFDYDDFEDFDYEDFDDIYVDDEYPAEPEIGISSGIIASLPTLDLLPYITAINDYIPHAIELSLDKITDVTKSTATITANGVSAETTLLSTTITAQNFYDMAIAILDDLASNKEIETILIKIYNEQGEVSGLTSLYASAEEFYNDFKEGLVSAKESLNEELLDYEGNETITLKIYLDSDYKYTGYEVLMPENNSIKVLLAKSEEKWGGEVTFVSEGGEISAIIDATETDGILNGTMIVSMLGTEAATVEFSGVDMNKIANGDFAGKFTIYFNDELGDQLDSIIPISSVKFEFNVKEMSDSKTAFDISLIMAGIDVDSDTTLAKISFENENKDATSFEFPTETVSDPDAWAATLNIEELLSRLKAIGLSEDILAGMMY